MTVVGGIFGRMKNERRREKRHLRISTLCNFLFYVSYHAYLISTKDVDDDYYCRMKEDFFIRNRQSEYL